MIAMRRTRGDRRDVGPVPIRVIAHAVICLPKRFQLVRCVRQIRRLIPESLDIQSTVFPEHRMGKIETGINYTNDDSRAILGHCPAASDWDTGPNFRPDLVE